VEPIPERRPELRASDADRERHADILREAYADGRLSAEEHAERIEAVWAARTRGDLQPLVADLVPDSVADALPKPYVSPPARVPARSNPGPVIAVFGGAANRPPAGVERLIAVAVFGGVDLDLRDALGPAAGGRHVRVTANCLFGGIDLIVPDDVEVRLGGIAIFGGNDDRRTAAARPGSPVLVVDGLVLFGGVTVRPPRPKELR
jgi:hypothetical protein